MTKSRGIRHVLKGDTCGKCGPVEPVEYMERLRCPNWPRLPQNRRTDPALLVNHMIEDVDTATRNATCRICGPVVAQKRADGYRCPNRVSNHRHNHLMNRYKISEADYSAMYDKQEGRCAICRTELPLLHVDHVHVTGVVRGLLCGKCNRGIGMFNDDPETLVAAARYLQGGDAT